MRTVNRSILRLCILHRLREYDNDDYGYNADDDDDDNDRCKRQYSCRKINVNS